jgi:hypothetical protein
MDNWFAGHPPLLRGRMSDEQTTQETSYLPEPDQLDRVKRRNKNHLSQR